MTSQIRNLITLALLLAFLVIILPLTVESNTASEVLVITKPNGEVVVHTDPGWHWQGFGEVVVYPRRTTFSFLNARNSEDGEDRSLGIRFNDSGTAKISGTLTYEMSADTEQVRELHSQYLSPESVQNQLIRGFLQMSVFNSGSLLSSTESYSSARGLMVEYIQRQLSEGIFATDGTLLREKDNLGFERTITRIQVRRGENGKEEISTKSPFQKFGIVIQTLNISDIEYDEKVSGQIQAQLDSVIKVQTAIADAKRAEQDKITAEQKGLADRAVAEAAANVELATATIEADKKKQVAVTEAEQKKEVAELEFEAAKLTAQATLEIGRAEAESRKLLMEADGALQPKLDAYVKAQEAWANAYSNARFAPVPHIMMGGSGGNSPGVASNAATQMLELIATKAAMDLGVDLQPQAPGPDTNP